MSRWNRSNLPKTIWSICFRGGLIVGSQAKAYAEGKAPLPDSDWDIMVPFNKWAEVRSTIPMTSKPNGFRGWRFKVEGIDVDVWPDDLQRYFQQHVKDKGGKGYAVDIRRGIVMTVSEDKEEI